MLKYYTMVKVRVAPLNVTCVKVSKVSHIKCTYV